MLSVNFDKYVKVMENNLRYKKSILDYIPSNHPLKILDYGCGSGLLTEYIASQFPSALVCGYDSSEEMVNLARKRKRYKQGYFYSTLDFEAQSFNIIVLSSVMHEVEEKEELLTYLSSLLKKEKGSKIIIRDGFIEAERENEVMVMQLQNPLEAISFKNLAGDSKVGNLPIEFKDSNMTGSQRSIKNFLQTYTWGVESLAREKNELHLISDKEYERFGKAIGCTNFILKPYCQENYFYYLQEIIKVRAKWNTHAIVVYEW